LNTHFDIITIIIIIIIMVAPPIVHPSHVLRTELITARALSQQYIDISTNDNNKSEPQQQPHKKNDQENNNNNKNKQSAQQSDRRVRFCASDANDCIEVPVQCFSHRLHWGPARTGRMYSECRRVVAVLATERPELVGCVERLFHATSSSTDASSSSSSSSAHCDLTANDRAALSMLAQQEELRGLEGRLYPTSKRHRQWAVRSVLARQVQLQGEEDPDRAARLLRARSMTVSRRSRELAWKLAQGDEMETFQPMTTPVSVPPLFFYC
jgi:hypothetical protein